MVVAEWKPALMQSTCDELTALGVENLGVVCDIQQRSEIDAMVAATVERFGRVDGLVNNAQTFRPMAPIAEVEEDDVDVFYRSGVKGTLWAMQAVYPHMREQQWGRIVNFASSMGITGGRGFAAYNASKEAIRALTRTAARVGCRRHHRQRHRARGRDASRRGRQAERGLPDLHRELPDGPPGRPRARHRPARVVPLLRCVPLPHRPHLHGRRWRVHVGVTDTVVRREGALHDEGFRFVVPVVPEPVDFDAQGHLNNAAIVRIFNDLRIAYVQERLGDRWREHLRAEGLVVVAREVHVLYESEGRPDEEYVGAMRYVRREGRAAIIEQRLIEASGARVARAWVVQLLARREASSTGPTSTSVSSPRSRGARSSSGRASGVRGGRGSERRRRRAGREPAAAGGRVPAHGLAVLRRICSS